MRALNDPDFQAVAAGIVALATALVMVCLASMMIKHGSALGPYSELMCSDYSPEIHGTLTGLEEDEYWNKFCEPLVLPN